MNIKRLSEVVSSGNCLTPKCLGEVKRSKRYYDQQAFDNMMAFIRRRRAELRSILDAHYENARKNGGRGR